MRRNIGIIIIFVLIIVAFCVEAFGRPRNKQKNRKSVQTNKICDRGIKNDEEIKSSTIDIDPYENCGLVGFGVVQKIPYQGATSGLFPVDVNLSSACVRCGMCLAIVERINQTLVEAHEIMRSNHWIDDAETDAFFEAICDNEFKHHGLRIIDGEHYIGDILPGSALVASNADGHWESNLRKKCHDIIDEVGAQKLYKYWKQWYNGGEIDLYEILCRSESGTLRDCRSIEGDAAKPELCRSFYQADIKVNAELSCS